MRAQHTAQPHTYANVQWKHKYRCVVVVVVVCLTFGWNVSDADTASAREEWCPRGKTQCSLWLISTCMHAHTQTQRLLYVGMRGSSPSLIPVELSTAHPAEYVSIAAGHAVGGTVCVTHGLRGKDFWSQTVHRCKSLNIDMYCRYYYTVHVGGCFMFISV